MLRRENKLNITLKSIRKINKMWLYILILLYSRQLKCYQQHHNTHYHMLINVHIFIPKNRSSTIVQGYSSSNSFKHIRVFYARGEKTSVRKRQNRNLCDTNQGVYSPPLTVFSVSHTFRVRSSLP